MKHTLTILLCLLCCGCDLAPARQNKFVLTEVTQSGDSLYTFKLVPTTGISNAIFIELSPKYYKVGDTLKLVK